MNYNRIMEARKNIQRDETDPEYKEEEALLSNIR